MKQQEFEKLELNEKLNVLFNCVNPDTVHEINDIFESWAENYFNTKRLNKNLIKKEVIDDFYRHSNSRLTVNSFTKKLKNFCSEKGYIYNPEVLCNNGARIIESIDGTTHEIIHIATKEVQQ